MIQIKAKIQLLPEGRKTPIVSGYHPDFIFIATLKSADLRAGKTFTFGEGNTVTGTGVVLEVLADH